MMRMEGGGGEQQPHPPRKVDDVPALRPVEGRETSEQRHVNGQDEHRLGPCLALGPADARVAAQIIQISKSSTSGGVGTGPLSHRGGRRVIRFA